MGRLKKRVTINLSPQVLLEARKKGWNISKICEKALIQELGLKEKAEIQNEGGIGTVGSDLMVARGRFELPSGAPEAPMLDRYTTGLL